MRWTLVLLPRAAPSGGPQVQAAPSEGGNDASDAAASDDEMEQARLEAVCEQMRRAMELVRHLRESLEPVAAGTAALVRQSTYVDDARKLVTEALSAVKPGLSGEAEALNNAHQYWKRAQLSPIFDGQKRASLAADVLVPEIREVIELLDKMMFSLARVTIPPRVNDWLDTSIPSYYLPFDDAFEDELPRSDHRFEILKDLAIAPREVPHGLVSPHERIIYRHSGVWWKRWGIIGILAVIVWSISAALLYGNIPLWRFGEIPIPLLPKPPAGDASLYLVPWTMVLAGIFVHIIVDANKRSLAAGRPPLFSLYFFPRWVEALSGVIVFKVVVSIITLAALFLFEAPGVAAGTAFLAGYSSDSVIDLFTKKIGQDTESKLEEWKKQLKRQE